LEVSDRLFSTLLVVLFGLVLAVGCSTPEASVDPPPEVPAESSVDVATAQPSETATPVPIPDTPTPISAPTTSPTFTPIPNDDDDTPPVVDIDSLIDLIGTQMAPFPTAGPSGGFESPPFPTMGPPADFEFPDFGQNDLEPDTFAGYELPMELEQDLSDPQWEPQAIYSDFISGHTLMDYVSTAYLKRYSDSTLDAIVDTGAGWVFYDQYATYYSMVPPEIDLIETAWEYGFRSLSNEEITELADSARDRGLKFGLILELNYDGMLSDRANPFSDSSMSQAQAAELYIGEQADKLDAGDPSAEIFWDEWFTEYTKFARNHAVLAAEIDASMLVVGKQLGSAVREANADRWRILIAELRTVYDGPIAYAQWVNETQTAYFGFPFDAVDYALIYDWGSYSTSATSKPIDIERVMRQRFADVYEPLYDATGTSVIFLAPYQSRDNALDQVWFEPAQAQSGVTQDEVTQAAMHQALLRAVHDQDWVAGVVSWGFWWRNDFDSIFGDGDASFDRSSTIRGKVAHEIWRRWFDN